MIDFLNELRATLKETWLSYYKDNSHWLKSTNWTKDTLNDVSEKGHRRPYANLILPVITALHPELVKDYLPEIMLLTNDSNKILEFLGLDFDPDVELKKREEEVVQIQEAEIVHLLPESESDSDTEYLNKIRENNLT